MNYTVDIYTTSLAAQPVMVDNILYISDYFTIRAFDPLTGRQLWNWTMDEPHRIDFCPPAVGGGVLYIGDGVGWFHAINSTTGEHLWSQIIGTNIWNPAAVASDSTVVMGSNDKIVRRFHPNGTQIWQFTLPEPMSSPPSFNEAEDTVYVIAGCFKMFALVWESGKLIWSQQFDWDDQGNCAAGGVALGHNGTLFYGDQSGYLRAYTSNGTLLWKYQFLDSQGAMMGSVAVSPIDNVIYAAVLEALFATWPNGTVRFQHKPQQNYFCNGATLTRNGTVWYTCGSAALAVDPNDGHTIFNFTDPQTMYYAGPTGGCNCPPPFSVPRCAVACLLY